MKIAKLFLKRVRDMTVVITDISVFSKILGMLICNILIFFINKHNILTCSAQLER